MESGADPEPADIGLPKEKARTRPRESALDELYNRRRRKNQDLFILVSDIFNRRGTGKTTLSLSLADHFDTTDEGLTEDKCSIDAKPLIDNYTDKPKGSALVLDEAEATASKYEAGSAVNKAIRELVSMGRVEEKYVIMNMPASTEIDRDLKKLADVWIMVESRGRALVHRLLPNAYDNNILTPKKEVFSWSDIEDDSRLSDIHSSLTDEKRSRLRGDEGTNLISASEVQERVKQAEKEKARQVRIENAQRAREKGLTTREVGDIVDMSRTWVGNHTDAPADKP